MYDTDGDKMQGQRESIEEKTTMKHLTIFNAWQNLAVKSLSNLFFCASLFLK